ncbi:MBL fold metallo-hydrolase [Aldersonia sp. NBC_00410]|uniref:cyclic nucleotide-degrading phosphodiesterase n=1 Tax=Aldersonia sp. NBC_00410 TaxID=2975954 RepID=UPI0022574DE3|nr:cyclic nucleotide-degrading phosphodiesterase [Aldersonia sp. NBC_00410]MCX5042888.1 MBL fold metallo-hydrolase [Aldersonia sp. NBC_00410]
MRLTVLGCSGSVSGPDSPASGYLLTAAGTSPAVIDFGPGVLGALQRYADPGEVSIFLSHLHADHCLDLPSLLVWRRYHPNSPGGRAVVYGPTDTARRIGVASAEVAGCCDDWSDTIDMRPWEATVPVQFGANTVTPWRVSHPPESYGLTLRSETGGTLCFTGDTALCPSVIDMARGADILLAEASWTHDPPNRPPDLHMSGTEAGRLAAGAGVQELLLTHIPPWTAREDVIAEAKAEFAGPVHAVSPGEVYEF